MKVKVLSSVLLVVLLSAQSTINAQNPPASVILEHFSPAYEGNPIDPMTICVMEAKIDGTYLLPGDEIGIFDGDICVGAGVLTQVINPNDNNTYLYIQCGKDDPVTPQQDGFINGHDISYKLWSSSWDAESYTESAVYPYPGWDYTQFEQLETSVVQLSGTLAVQISFLTPHACKATSIHNLEIPLMAKTINRGGDFRVAFSYASDKLSYTGVLMQNDVFTSNPLTITETNGFIEVEWEAGTDSLIMVYDSLLSFGFSVTDTASLLFECDSADSYFLNYQTNETIAALYENATQYVVAPPQISNILSTDISCHDENDGSISISASGTTDLLYSIDNGSSWENNQGNFTDLSEAGYYTAVADTFGCETEWTNNPVQILNPAVLSFDAVLAEEVTGCFNSDNGSISITASGGTGSLYYSIDNGSNWSNTALFEGLATGDYQLKIKDDNDCQLTYSANPVVISGPDAVVISDVESTNISPCYGNQNGSIEITASGGVASYYYSIDDGANWQNSSVFTNLAAGNYAVHVKDANDCSLVYAQNPVVLAQPDAIVINDVVASSPLCNATSNGSISVDAIGGTGNLHYSIDNGSNWQSVSLFENLAAGSYDVKIKDDNDCEILYESNPVILSDPAAISLDYLEVDQVLCNGANNGSIEITASGGSGNLNYSIDNGSNWSSNNYFENLAPGDYSLKIKDGNDCVFVYAANPIVITEPDAISINNVAAVDLQCFNTPEGSIEITASGGTASLQYSIDDGANWQSAGQFENLAAGSYTIKVKDANECLISYENNPVQLFQPDEIFLSELEIISVQCHGADDGIIEMLGEGGSGSLQYSVDDGASWSPNGLFTQLSPADYHLKIKDANGCMFSYANPVTIPEPEAIVISNVTAQNLLCNGIAQGSIEISASGGTGNLHYSIDDGQNWQSATTFQDLSSGDYYLKAKDDNDCEIIYTGNPVTITEPAAISLSELSVSHLQCNGASDGSIEISASGGTGSLHYSIDNGINWQTNSLFPGLTAGTYNIQIKDDNDCLFVYASNPVMLTEPEALLISNVTSLDLQCHNIPQGSISITASGGTGTLQYSIDNGASWQTVALFENLSAGTYQIKIKDENDCEYIYSLNPVTINEPAAISLDEMLTNDVQCYGADDGSIEISASGGTGTLQYSIDNGSNWSAGALFANLSPGDYFLQIKDGNECLYLYPSNPVTISEPTELLINDVVVQDVLCYAANNGSINIAAAGGTGTLAYSIDEGESWQNNSLFEDLEPGSYNVQVKDEHDCLSVWPANPIVVTEPEEIVINSVAYYKASENGASDARILIDATGGSGDLEYSVDNGQNWLNNSGSFETLTAGSYQLLIKDANDCEIVYASNPLVIPEVHFTKVWSGNPLNAMDFSITHALIDDLDLEWMDEIAVYDGEQCVGSGVLDQSIDSLNNLSYINIICSMDDAGQNDTTGYIPGNPVKYRIWDESAQEEYYFVYPEFPFAPQFAFEVFTSGESTIAQLLALPALSQQFDLGIGWNIVSWNIQPENKDMEYLLAELILLDPQMKMIDESGHILQQMPWGWVNTIGDMSNQEGYQLKISSDAQFSTMGSAVQLPFAISLSPAWNIISWPLQDAADAENVMQQLIDNGHLDKVIDQNGNILQQMPWGWVNTIGDFQPNQGYQVKVFNDCSLDLDESYGDFKSNLPEQPGAYMLESNPKGNPYNPMTFAIQSNGQLPQNAEIGVYKGEECFGAAVLTGEYIYISAGTDEADTDEKEGFRPGDAFTFKYITEGMQEPCELEVTWLQGDKTYQERGTFVGEIKSLTAAEELQATASWIGEARPNPARDEVFVDYYLNTHANLSWQMVDAQGRVLLQDQKESPQGRHQQRLDLSKLPSGIYYLHLKAEGEGMFAERVLRVVRLH